MVSLGEADAKAAVAAGPTEAENTSHFFALKNSHDERVRGVNYDQFKAMKANGVFGEEYRFKEDPKYQSMFLQ